MSNSCNLLTCLLFLVEKALELSKHHSFPLPVHHHHLTSFILMMGFSSIETANLY